MGLTWLGIVTALILLLMMYRGYRRGFIKEIISFFFVFLAIALAVVLHPGVSTFIENNTPIYQKIQESCMELAEGYMASSIVNGLSYLIAYILASLAIKVICCILDIIAGLPLINTANRFTGVLLGLAKGIIFVWLAFLLLTVLCTTKIGKQGLELIQKDTFLRILYDCDLFINLLIK